MTYSFHHFILTCFISISFLFTLTWFSEQHHLAASQTVSDSAEPGVRFLTVSGVSMQPALNPGDKVKLVTGLEIQYKRGDLVAVKFSTREHLMVKRVIAIPDDEVYWRNGQVFINKKPLVMAGWPVNRRIPQRSWKLLGIQLKHYNNRVPPNNLIVMGDNTKNSFDSGDFGMLSMSQIAGYIVH